MTDTSLTHSMERRMQRIALEDGLFEIALGLWLSLMGGAYFLNERFQPGLLIFVPLYLLIALLPPLLMSRGIRAARECLVYDRRGYVRFKTPNPAERRRRMLTHGLLGGVIGAATGAITASLARPDTILIGLPLLFGGALALAYVVFALRLGIYRWLLLAGLVIAATLAGAVFMASPLQAIIATIGAQGAALLIMGLAVLLVFLRRYPPAESQEGAQ